MQKKLMVIILMWAMLTSCGNNAVDSGKTDVTIDSEKGMDLTETTSKYTDELPQLKYDGKEFRVLTFDQATLSGARSIIDVNEQNADTINDAIYIRNRNVEERLDIIMKVSLTDYAPTANLRDMENRILSGDDSYDLVMDFANNVNVLAMAGYLYDYRDLKYVDLTKKYWCDSLNASLSIANRNFMAVGDYSFSSHDGTGAIIFNKKLHDELKLDDVYDLVREGKWTYDAFQTQAKAAVSDLNGDSKMDKNDRYGYISIPKEIPSSFWIGAGELVISKDKDDIPYLSADKDERFLNSFDKLLNIIWSDDIWFPSSNHNGTTETPKFEDGQGLFAFQRLYTLDQMRDTEINFGIIPFPKYEETQEKYWSRVAMLLMGMVPVNVNDPDMIGAVLEALCSESRNTTIPAYYDIMLESKLTRDEESSEMLNVIFENRVCDHGDLTWCPILRDGIFSSMVMGNDHDVISKIESIRQKLQTSIDETVEGYKKAGNK